jgi:hypothetical protein
MMLTVTLRDKHGDEFVRTIEVASALDFSKVERAAAAWAKKVVRSMPLYGNDMRREMTMHLTWADGPVQRPVTGLSVHELHPKRKKRRK